MQKENENTEEVKEEATTDKADEIIEAKKETESLKIKLED